MTKQKLWYAIQVGEYDNDWGFGFYDMNEAEEKAEEIAKENPTALVKIAVIDIEEEDSPFCIEEIVIQESSEFFKNYTVKDFKEVQPADGGWFVDDACRALMNYYEFVKPEVYGHPEDLNGMWEDVGNYEDACEMYGFDAEGKSREEIENFVENELAKQNDVEIAYYRAGDTVLVAR